MITVFLPLTSAPGPYEEDLLTLIERTALEDARADACQSSASMYELMAGLHAGGDVCHRDWHCYRRLYTAERARH